MTDILNFLNCVKKVTQINDIKVEIRTLFTGVKKLNFHPILTDSVLLFYSIIYDTIRHGTYLIQHFDSMPYAF